MITSFFTLSINQKSLLICFLDNYFKNQQIGIISDSMIIEKFFILGAYIVNSSMCSEKRKEEAQWSKKFVNAAKVTIPCSSEVFFFFFFQNRKGLVRDGLLGKFMVHKSLNYKLIGAP